MKIFLPIVTRDELKDGKREFAYEEKEVQMNNTMTAELRWEAEFPELARRESLPDYALRLRDMDGKSIPVIISRMKVIYSFLEIDMKFIDFLKLFDFSRKEYTDKLIAKIREAFDAIFDTAAEKN